MTTFDRQLPDALVELHNLSADLYWSWNHASDALWLAMNAEVWEQTHNPILVLQLTSDTRLQELAADPAFVQLLGTQVQARRDRLQRPSWFAQQYPNSHLRGIAYFSMEFGLCDPLPLYAGGLGMLAGDYLKTACDLGVPLVGVGLLYQEGYFRQSLDSSGWQQQTYLYNDPGSLPLQPLRAVDGSWQTIETNFLCRQVRFRVWEAQLGQVRLYLLDSNDPRNQPRDRGITSKLYGGGSELRLVQEIALGICGWRLLDTLGLAIDICHLNEGHAAFATLERIRHYCERQQVDFWEGLWATRAGNIFTTHTPVEAGFDRYPAALIRQYGSEAAGRMGISIEDILGLGRINPKDDSEPFNMAYLALRTCAASNGVSQLHGQVSRRIFQPLFPRWPEREVPVGQVTNGVHLPTWDSPGADQLWTHLYGKHRWREPLAKVQPDAFDLISDQQLWELSSQGRARLVDYARERLARQWRQESNDPTCAFDLDLPLDPNILTLGFARRFAEYKRPDLLLQDPERLARLLTNPHCPVQLIVAGKAHPADDRGKRALQRWYQFAQRPDVHQHLVLVEDYDISLALHLVQGVDVWINNPRRPWEACGTSGMKVLVNGGLNLSSLDGWWAEAYRPALGWALGDGQEHGPEADAAEAEQLYQLLEQQVVPLFYQRNGGDIPHSWVAKIRASMTQLTARFSSNRMVQEYLEDYYLPAAEQFQARQAEQGQLARELRDWQHKLEQHWHEIHIGQLNWQEHAEGWELEVNVYLGGLSTEQVRVQVFADPTEGEPGLVQDMNFSPLPAAQSGTGALRYLLALSSQRPRHDFSLRVIPAHSQARVPAECHLITWSD